MLSEMARFMENVKKAAMDAYKASDPAGLFFGTVTSASPLAITIDQNQILEEDALILSSLVQDITVDATMDHTTGSYTHTHSISDTYSGGGTASSDTHTHSYSGRKSFTLHFGLQAGEKVMLLRMQGGQRYLVLDRITE